MTGISKDIQDAVELFMPLHYPHRVSAKIWGAICTIFAVSANVLVFSVLILTLSQIVGEISVNSRSASDEVSWLVREGDETAAIAARLKVKPPTTPVACLCAFAGYNFRSTEEGVKHLRQYHYKTEITGLAEHESGAAVPSDVALRRFLMTTGEARNNQRLRDQLEFLLGFSERIGVFANSAKKLRLGVVVDDKNKDPRYKLTKPMVDSFAHFVALYLLAARSVSAAGRPHRETTVDAEVAFTKSKQLFSEGADSLSKISNTAQTALNAAHRDLLHMSRTTTATQTLNHASVGVEFVVAAVLSNVRSAPVLKDMQINGLYHHYMTKLVSAQPVYYVDPPLTSFCSNIK